MEWSDNALVLSMGRFREIDVWLRLLTRRHGIVVVFAFGGSRSRKRFCGCLDLGNELQIRVRSSRNGTCLNLQEAILLKGTSGLRSDWNRFGMFVNCVRFLETLGVPPDGTADSFTLLKDTLCVLEETDTPHTLLPILFRLRLASDQGYAPALGACSLCGCQQLDKASFLVAEGVLVCAECSSLTQTGVEICGKTLDVLRSVQEKSPLGWDFLSQSGSGEQPVGALLPDERRECAQAVDGFVQYHLGIAWNKGRFRRV